ncbi:S8 family serine peptidase [Nonomuraea sp. SMC257]|uniref:S8 family serine peptidase n=1 Tax=Nonomuraea montanisoli TaxID=2741721 RepID=A0A7Y6M6U7_9ACTN|nr:S8 family serine peptidase [Nonomuraea montanisoli]NUW35986.1 S8 family serine peptidase [Nonomuraea montanisoli]
MQRTTWWAGVTVLAAAMAAQPAALPSAAAQPAAPPQAVSATGDRLVTGDQADTGDQAVTAARTAAGVRTVTLVTGDKVTVTGPASATVEPGEGREKVTFLTDVARGRLRVLPSDAAPLVRAGRLDPRLFDVTGLLELGYDDSRQELPLLVTGAPTGAPTGASGPAPAVRAMSGFRPLDAVRGFAVRQRRADAARTWQPLAGGTGKVWLDGRRQITLDVSVKQVGAPQAWERGHTGAGVKVAVLDTGIDVTHPDLAGRVAARADFTEAQNGRDLIGHGTHVASTIAGSGAASDGRYRGVAPGATLLDGKVCEATWCADSAVLAGMQWAVEQGARVVNLSLGSPDTPGADPLEEAVRTLSERYGTLFVTAAGNYGADRTLISPGTADAALQVGAVSKSGEQAEFASRGPRAGDDGLKPDITAPGVDITAARGKDSPGDGSYVAMSGTSMATPHVTGVAALLAGEHPDWKGDTLKAALTGAARPLPGIGVFAQGAGLVDADRGTRQAVTAEPSALSFGRQPWPHGDDQPAGRTIVYRNHQRQPVTLRLEVRGDRTFSVAPATLTVPAGGQAEAVVTADTRAGGPDGLVGAHVVATGDDDLVVSTAVGVDKEVESYDLTLRFTGRDGGPAGDAYTTLYRLDADQAPVDVEQPEGPVTLRLPKGRWLVRTTIRDERSRTLLVHPGLGLDRSRTLDADARLGRPISLTPPRADAVPLQSEIVYQYQAAGGTPRFSGWLGGSYEGAYTAQLGPARSYPGVRTKVAGVWAAARTGSPYAYHLTWFHSGGMVNGFERRVAQRDLAAIRTDYARHLPDARANAASGAWPRDGVAFSFLSFTTFGTPFKQVEYVNTDDGVRWRRHLFEYGSDGRLNRFDAPFTVYRAGKAYTELWNRGVFSPALPWAGEKDLDGVSRTGDVISTDLLMYGDGRGALGSSTRATQRTALYRDGVLVGEQPEFRTSFTVPEGEAAYRLVVESERGAPATLSTRVSGVWTFRSGHVAGDTPVRLPVSVLRFGPALDAWNSAPSGRRFTVPVTVRPLEGSAARPVRRLSVEVSYDDGATWARAEVRGSAAVLRHPAGEGYVSLRARAVDEAGAAVEQTVIRAYRIRPL